MIEVVAESITLAKVGGGLDRYHWDEDTNSMVFEYQIDPGEYIHKSRQMLIRADGALCAIEEGLGGYYVVGVVNEGNYIAASRNFASRTIPEYWDGDLNKDQIVNIIDLNMILIGWGKSVSEDPATLSIIDSDGSGVIDMPDLTTVLIDWGKTGYKP